jgi:hypothetical protein
LLSIQRVFRYKDEDFEEIGQFDVRLSNIITIFLQNLGVLGKFSEKATGAAQYMWSKYFTKGKLTVIDVNLEEKYIIVRLEDFALHPLHCRNMVGQFSSAIKMIFGSSNCEEKKCVFKGDPYHEFLLKWD